MFDGSHVFLAVGQHGAAAGVAGAGAAALGLCGEHVKPQWVKISIAYRLNSARHQALGDAGRKGKSGVIQSAAKNRPEQRSQSV